MNNIDLRKHKQENDSTFGEWSRQKQIATIALQRELVEALKDFHEEDKCVLKNCRYRLLIKRAEASL